MHDDATLEATTAPRFEIRPRNPINHAAAILGYSRETLYKRAKEGKIKIVRDGGRSYVSGAEILRYLAACEAES